MGFADIEKADFVEPKINEPLLLFFESPVGLARKMWYGRNDRPSEQHWEKRFRVVNILPEAGKAVGHSGGKQFGLVSRIDKCRVVEGRGSRGGLSTVDKLCNNE